MCMHIYLLITAVASVHLQHYSCSNCSYIHVQYDNHICSVIYVKYVYSTLCCMIDFSDFIHGTFGHSDSISAHICHIFRIWWSYVFLVHITYLAIIWSMYCNWFLLVHLCTNIRSLYHDHVGLTFAVWQPYLFSDTCQVCVQWHWE